jgi:C_GCAxxG_C_C family probable redox protein
LLAVCQELGIENELIPRIATAFGGGMGGTGAVCGAVAGAAMAIGIKHGREEATEPRDHAYELFQEFRRRFEGEMGHICCRELTGIDLSTPEGFEAFWASDVPVRVCLRAGGVAFDIAMDILRRTEQGGDGA